MRRVTERTTPSLPAAHCATTVEVAVQSGWYRSPWYLAVSPASENAVPRTDRDWRKVTFPAFTSSDRVSTVNVAAPPGATCPTGADSP